METSRTCLQITYPNRTEVCSDRKRIAKCELNWAYEKFSDYLLGMSFQIETDHKPLISLLGVKNLKELLAQIQRFRMQLMRFTFTVTIADMLSRAPSEMPSDANTHFNQDTEMFVATVMSCLPATEKKLTEITQKQEEDEVCKQLKQ